MPRRYPVLRVARWRELYEPPVLQSRPARPLEFVALPVALRDSRFEQGYSKLVGQRKGSAYLGGWAAIVFVAAASFPRGVLIDQEGRGLTSITLSKQTHLPSKLFDELVPFLMQEIAWLQPVSANDVAEIIEVCREQRSK